MNRSPASKDKKHQQRVDQIVFALHLLIKALQHGDVLAAADLAGELQSRGVTVRFDSLCPGYDYE